MTHRISTAATCLCLAACVPPYSQGSNIAADKVGTGEEPSNAANNEAVDAVQGFHGIDARSDAAIRRASSQWLGCIVYGIGQIDRPSEPAATIADAAMAGCLRAETNLADRLAAGMRPFGSAMEARAQAQDVVDAARVRMRSIAIRLVLSKHDEEARTAGANITG